MRRRMFSLVFVIALAISAIAAGTASAKGTLHLTAGGYSLKLGDYVELEDQGGTLTAESGAGNISCPMSYAGAPYNSLVGADATNNEKIDKIEIKKATGKLYGGECTSTVPIGASANVYIYNNSGALGTLSLGKTKAQYITSATEDTYLYFLFPSGYCQYSITKLKGSVTEGTPLKVSFVKQKVSLQSHNIEGCPKKFQVSLAFNLSWYSPNPTEEFPSYIALTATFS